MSNANPARAAAPARNGLSSRVLVVSDSHTKCGALLHWIAAEKSAGVKRATAHAEVRYVEVDIGGQPCRVLGITPGMLQVPAVATLACDADRILVVASVPGKAQDDKALSGALVPLAPLFIRSPLVSCIFPRAAEARLADARKNLKEAGFRLRDSSVDAGDFAAIWRELCIALPAEEAAGGASPEAKIAPVPQPHPKKGPELANAAETLNSLMQIEGAMGGLIADYQSGMVLAKAGGGVNLDVAAAGNSEVIKSKMKTMHALGIKEGIEDILITLGSQYHVIRPLTGKGALFMYLVLDKAKANLAMARFKVADVEKAMAI